jgi:glycosyltransferase involved in cell wall biosynthesis
MKILFNTFYQAFQNPGGGEVVLQKTYEHLLKLNVEVVLFNKWETKMNQFDLIHNFGTPNYREWEGFKTFCPKLAVTPVVWPSTNKFDVLNFKLKQQIKTMVGQDNPENNITSAFQYVDRFFPSTNMEASRINQYYDVPLEKMATIYNAVEMPAPESATNTFKSKFNVDNYLLFVGRISPLKNVHSIIEAVNLCNKKLVIIGQADKTDFKYEKSLREKYKDHTNIIFIGPIYNNPTLLSDAYYGANGVIVASLFETFSLVGLEAGIRKVPLFMTEAGATKEVYQDKATFINPNSIFDIAEKIAKETSKVQIESLQNLIIENYTWNEVARKLVQNYQEILKT